MRSLKVILLYIYFCYFRAAPTSQAEIFQRRPKYDGSCTPAGSSGSAKDAISCVNQLKNRGTETCATGKGAIKQVCCVSTVRVYVSAINNPNGASSYYRDIATGAQWIVDNCSKQGSVKGRQAAGGNGDLIVSIEGFLVVGAKSVPSLI
ncbi:hypothetical protein EG329_000277 [Mollisiaceae sp. DMI_Dod_QoI]|nr:hypothetical protein EG329_000277 [Helotiales sp. DMI_Dod_QoI]